jgi:hypothetical protein
MVFMCQSLFARPREDLEQIIVANPNKVAEDKFNLYLAAFLADTPTAELVAASQPLAWLRRKKRSLSTGKYTRSILMALAVPK